MKKYLLYISLICSTGFFSCKKFLDQVPNDRPTLEDVFQHRNTLESYLANIYSYIPDESNQRFVGSGNGNGSSGPWTGGSDEAKFTWTFVYSGTMNLGSWAPTDGTLNTFWQRYYQAIRSAGYFMAHIDECKELGAALNKQYKAEAKALRAINYYYLVRMFGPVMLLGDATNAIAPDAPLGSMQIPRNSFDECISYIISELDAAAADLPASPPTNDDYGRINRPVALAYKIEALMLSASPLFNGNADFAALKNKDGKQLIPQQYDANKWKKAADVARDFITEFIPGTFDLYRENDANGYNPYLSCRNVMLNDWNKEWIFGRPANSGNNMQYERCPRHDGAPAAQKASGALSVTQRMVDAYFMSNGLSPVTGYNADGTPIVDPASGYQLTGFTSFKAPYDNAARNTFNQWVDREPRFYVGITYDGSYWLNQSGYTTASPLVTGLQYSGNSGHKGSGSDYSTTGYVCRKNITTGNWNTNSRAMVMIRVANIFLNYIEALNETEPSNADILKYLNQIRSRAGIPQYGSGAGFIPVPADMRQAIRKERRVELAFENSRYFDTRRWKIAEQTDNGAFYGLNIDKDGAAFYTPVVFETRVFQKKHYLFPLPQTDININLQLVQNTGW